MNNPRSVSIRRGKGAGSKIISYTETCTRLAFSLGSSDLFAQNSILVFQRVEFLHATADLPQ